MSDPIAAGKPLWSNKLKTGLRQALDRTTTHYHQLMRGNIDLWIPQPKKLISKPFPLT